MALSQTIHFKMPPFHDLTFQGDAIIPSGTSFIRLTKIDSNGNPLPRRVGRVMYSKPFTFWGDGKQVEFETTIKFKIKPSPTDKYPADGIAFFIAPVGSTIPDGSDGGNLGIFGPDGTGDSIFAVEFDPFSNPWDPPSLHIGIDVNNHKSVKTKNLDDFVLGEVVTLSIKYDQAQAKNTITVTAENESGEHYDIPPYELDLRTILKKEVQVGISASTGDDMAHHDIYDWEFTANMIPVDGAGIRQVVST